MSNREKLIELMEEAYFCSIESLADHLIANGVTFATDNNVGGKWIPVTEMLPERNMQCICRYVFGNDKQAFFQVLDYFATDKQPHFQH